MVNYDYSFYLLESSLSVVIKELKTLAFLAKSVEPNRFAQISPALCRTGVYGCTKFRRVWLYSLYIVGSITIGIGVTSAILIKYWEQGPFACRRLLVSPATKCVY